MKNVEYFTFMLPPDIWRKRPHPSSYKLSIEMAATRYPGATPILSSREVRTLPETREEMERHQIQHKGRAKTPGEERLQDWITARIGMKSEKLD